MGGGGSGSADALNAALFKLLDTDKDGKLSKKELANAEQVLLKAADANDDEMVTTDELLGRGGRSINDGGDVFVFDPSARTPVARDKPLFVVPPGDRGRDLARELLKHYGPKKDAKNVKKLTRADLNLDEATFKKLDADEDGALDNEEL